VSGAVREWDRDSKFADSERLRRVLTRLHSLGAEGWRTDPEAEELARYAIDRFAALAEKHGLERADGGSAAFEAMRSPGAVFAAARALEVGVLRAGDADFERGWW
jgi:hypothetical protein